MTWEIVPLVSDAFAVMVIVELVVKTLLAGGLMIDTVGVNGFTAVSVTLADVVDTPWVSVALAVKL